MTEIATRVRIATAVVMIATFLLGGAVGALSARRWWHPHHRRDMPGLPLAELGLTPDQDKAARAILDSRRPELDAIFKESFPKVRKIHEECETEVRKLLTPEQQKKLDELKARRPQHGPGGGPGGFFGGPPPGMSPPQGALPPPNGAPAPAPPQN